MSKTTKKIVVRFDDHAEIKRLAEEMNQIIERAMERADFLKRQMKSLTKDAVEKKKDIWNKIQDEIERLGVTGDRDPHDICWKLDDDVGAIIEHTREEQENPLKMLAQLFQ